MGYGDSDVFVCSSMKQQLEHHHTINIVPHKTRVSRCIALEKDGKDGRIRSRTSLHMKSDEYVGVDDTMGE